SHPSSPSHERDFYELRIYHIESPDQEKRMDSYLGDAFLPALHRFGIAKVGVFKPLLSDQKEKGSKIYVFIPYTSMEQFLELPAALEKNRDYAVAGRDYIDASHDNPAYVRMEKILM